MTANTLQAVCKGQQNSRQVTHAENHGKDVLMLAAEVNDEVRDKRVNEQLQRFLSEAKPAVCHACNATKRGNLAVSFSCS